MTWDGVFRLRGETLRALASRHGGCVVGDASRAPLSVAQTDAAGAGQIAPVLSRRFVPAARAAGDRGATLLADLSLAGELSGAPAVWCHEFAHWVLAALLDVAPVPDVPPVLGAGCVVASSAFLGPRVVLGERVVVGPGAVIGHPGFGWAFGPSGAVRSVPQRAGVVLGDDVSVGPLSTIDAGTLAPTRVGRGVKLDAHVHVGHNVEIGEGTIVAAQCGFAGSVRIGRGVLIGGQAGVADHVVVGDGARIAAKSGVIGDVAPGATVAGYPAMARMRWLRALARLERLGEKSA